MLLAVILSGFIAVANPIVNSPADKVEVIKFSGLDKLSTRGESSIRIINFWASWCGPCVKELPAFDAVNSAGQAEVIFVSLDFIKDLEKVSALVAKKNLTSKVYLLDETDYDRLITKVDPNWSGAIPATLLIDSSGKKHFYEKPFSAKELEDLIKFYTPK